MELNSSTFGMMLPDAGAWNYKPTLLGGSTAPTPGTGLGMDLSLKTNTATPGLTAADFGAIGGIFGAIGTAYGAYAQTRSIKQNLEFQSAMAAINSRMAENTAQTILRAGEQQQGQVGLRAGKVKSSQKASQAARGVAIGEGNAAEEVATTDLMKEIDMNTINANAVRQAWAARTQATNAANESLLKGTTADTTSSFSSAMTSLMGSATSVASNWYRDTRTAKLAAALGVS